MIERDRNKIWLWHWLRHFQPSIVNYQLSTVIILLFFVSCSTTKNLPEGETLYTGIHQIAYLDKGDKAKKMNRDSTGVITAIADAAEKVDNLLKGDLQSLGKLAPEEPKTLTKEERKVQKEQQKAAAQAFETAETEVNAVLQYPPNNSLFGSSYHRTPFPIGLWAYNAFVNKTSGVDKWMYNTFGGKPVLITTVNPDTRVKVATNTLHNYGYFHGDVKYFIEKQKHNGRKAKMNYFVKAGRVFRLDSIAYLNFPHESDSLIHSSMRESLLRKGDPFSVVKLTGEQTRLEKLFRNHGYYFYNAQTATYKADTIAQPYKVQLRMQPVNNISERMKHPWYIGQTYITVLRNDGDTIQHTFKTHSMTMFYSGQQPPLYPLIWFQNIMHRHGKLYTLDEQEKTQEMLGSLGLFSQLNVNYMARDTTETCDTLDLWISAVMDKVYNADLEMNVTTKSNDRIGPGITFDLNRRNAFRGAELVSFKIFGSYEWKTNNESTKHGPFFNSFEVGTQLSFDIPRIVFPGIRRRQFRFPTATSFALNADWLNRAQYFNLFSMGVGVTYSWHRTQTSRHELIPFSLSYDKLLNSSHDFDSIMQANPALYVSMRNRFVPAMQYTYTYTSPSNKRNPLWWQLMVKEAGNVTSGIFALAGRKFSEPDKKFLHNPFAQYLKVTTELHNTFKIHREYKFVTRLMAGFIYSYGNSTVAPYSDQFYVGGANSVRAFTIRTVGPGHFTTTKSKYSYMDQTGDLKLEGNVEFRFPVFGSLYGAAFVDAGNVWLLRDDDARPGGRFSASRLVKDLALGTGLGLRYDMSFLVLRLDLGVAIHDPSSTESGYYNISRFKDGLALHFAIGYPF